MAKYTMELRRVCDFYTRDQVENWFKDYNISDYLRPEEVQILNKNNMWSKEKLAKKIVDHYFMREIGFETPALFAHYAKVTMNEIMEEKLPLLYSRAIEYDPLINVDFTETFARTVDSEGNSRGTTNSNGTSESSSDSTSNNLAINNNTPQQRITKQNLDSGIYASTTNQNDNTSHITDETTTNNNSTMSSSLIPLPQEKVFPLGSTHLKAPTTDSYLVPGAPFSIPKTSTSIVSVNFIFNQKLDFFFS